MGYPKQENRIIWVNAPTLRTKLKHLQNEDKSMFIMGTSGQLLRQIDIHAMITNLEIAK